MSMSEFDRQVGNLLDKGYPQVAGLDAEAFRGHLELLRDKVSGLECHENDLERGRLGFAIVIKSQLVDAGKAMALVERDGKGGVSKMYPREPEDFETIVGVDLPGGLAYLLADIDRGKESINVTPNEAMKMIAKKGRSPLTIDEGVAIVTHYPDFLTKNNCFSLLASRYPGDQRVPAIWIDGKKSPKLGWCWAGNPHTWLGSASCGSRLGA